MVGVAVIALGLGLLLLARPRRRQSITGIRPVAPALGRTSLTSWSTSTTSAASLAWTNTGPNDAYFYGSHSGGETITISNSVVVGNITFAGTTYTLTGGTVDLAATSGTSTITTNYNATISSDVIGTVAMTKSAPPT